MGRAATITGRLLATTAGARAAIRLHCFFVRAVSHVALFQMTNGQAEFGTRADAQSLAHERGAIEWLVPSVRDMIFIFLLWSILAGTLSNRPLADPDIGWHIRTGELIVSTHVIPRTDPFSSTMYGQRWFAWEWLYDFALGILYRGGGLNGVVWLCAVIVAATFMLLLSLLMRRGCGLLLAVVLMLLAEAAATLHLFARPHIVSWLFVLLWFAALERWARGQLPRWGLWFFPASTLLWVNLHGGWIFGFALLALYGVAEVIEWIRVKDAFARVRSARRVRGLIWAGLVSAVVTLANPFGWQLHVHIYRYLGDEYLMNRIAEFRSPDFHGWAQRCFAFILLISLISFAANRRRVRLREILVVLLAVYSGVLSSRNVPISSLLLVLIVGPMLWEQIGLLADRPGAWGSMRSWLRRIVEFSGRMEEQEFRLRGHLWPVLAAAVALTICFHGGWIGSRRVIDAHFDAQRVPVAAANFLAAEGGVDPLFSTDSWGGYLIYRLYPARQVVVDDRHDLYGPDRIRELVTVMQGETGWRHTLDGWRVRTAVLPAGSTLSNLLRELPLEWRIVYEDKVAVVFERL